MNALGKQAEQEACRYLKKQGYQILAQNWRHHFGEIDIIAQDAQELVFVEVKSLTNSQTFDPMDHITHKKINTLRKLAQSYTSNLVKDIDQRIDIILVYCDTLPWRIDHFKDAIE
ncbi:MAG: YraN family protein [Deltaproteobacteria bacterium]|nr:YraN family protein [Deltaproteobacteria bacterium]